MKKGIARSVKPVVEAYIRCGSIVSREPSPRPMKKETAVSPMATAIGRFIMMRTSNTVKISSVSMSRFLHELPADGAREAMASARSRGQGDRWSPPVSGVLPVLRPI